MFDQYFRAAGNGVDFVDNYICDHLYTIRRMVEISFSTSVPIDPGVAIREMCDSYINFYINRLLESNFTQAMFTTLQTAFAQDYNLATMGIAVGAAMIFPVVTDDYFMNVLGPAAVRVITGYARSQLKLPPIPFNEG